MAIQPNMLLTADLFDRARRRIAALPDHAATRLAVKPEADGFATADVVAVEPTAIPRGTVEWAGATARTIANREIDISARDQRTGRGVVGRLALVEPSSRRERRLRRAARAESSGRLEIRRIVAIGRVRRRAGVEDRRVANSRRADGRLAVLRAFSVRVLSGLSGPPCLAGLKACTTPESKTL